MTTPVAGLTELSQGQNQASVLTNTAIRVLESLARGAVISVGANFPPSSESPARSESPGDMFVVGTAGSGPWDGQDNKLAILVSNSDWHFISPTEGMVVYNVDDAKYWRYSGSPLAWDEFTSPFMLQIACSDLTSTISAGTSKGYVRAPRAFTLTEVRGSLLTASTSGAVTIDINKNGTTVMSVTKLTIDQDEKTSESAATPAVISTSAFADDDEITIDIDGAGTGAKGLVVTLLGTII